MSSAEATLGDAVVVVGSTKARSRDGARAATVLTAIVVTQLTWLAALVYGAIWLIT